MAVPPYLNSVARPGGQTHPAVLFHASQLTKTYYMGEVAVQALRAVDLNLYEGEFVVLLGPSGSGKSTLLNILGGLDVPSSGAVYFKHQNLTAGGDRLLTRFRRESIGFIFQFYNLIPSLTARENVALVTDIAPIRCGLRWRWNWWVWAIAWITFPLNCRVGNSNGWPLPAPLPSGPRCSFATNPPEH